ncbi:MAG: c-type cytochrome biogenesis protein CcsB [Candidatus Aminicenantes bacterium]|nr:c-type cytochrome biogenesis protein CcsB [Candidatus Aminicenantes bacterium]
MTESALFFCAFILYAVSAASLFVYLFSEKDKWARTGYQIIFAGFIIHTAALAARTLESGHAPFTNMYESLSFLAWCGAFAYVSMEGKYKIRKAGPYFILIIIVLMALASSPLMPKEVRPLMPALQSYWLWLHVSVTLLGEAFFAMAFVTSILYLITKSKKSIRSKQKKDLTPERLDFISYKCIAVGFPLFTLGGLVFGMIWAYKAWGRYWGWDPKEVWSLITWFVFALYLHTRLVMGWKGKRSAITAIIGFLAALFTYFGVNYLLAGLHSYL